MKGPITTECITCGRAIETEFVSLMGQTFIAERTCVLCREASEKALQAAKKGANSVEVVAVVKDVSRKQITPKNGGNPFTLFEIDAGDNTWTTKRQELALTAHSLKGRTAVISGKVEQKGNYTNYYLDSIAETDAPPTSDIFDTPTATIPESNGNNDAREENIHRQVATKVAAQLADNPADFWQNVDTLMRFYQTGVHPQQEGTNGVAATQEEGFTGDDNIPF